ncbi:MAG: hypothetical protein WC485_00350 [Opitutaceae bacterium]
MSEHIERLEAMIDPRQQTWDLSPNDVVAIRHVLVELKRLREIVGRKLHMRRCHDCGHHGYYADSIRPYCLCDKCGSQDTRRVAAESPKGAST